MNLKEIEVKNKELTDWNILSFWRGSMAHGTYVPKENPDSIDDKDLMYVIVPPIDYYFGLKTYGSHGTKEIGKGTE